MAEKDIESQELKLLVMGSGGVGKSALTVRFVNGNFVARYDPTIEDRHSKSMEVDGKAVQVAILDTAGQEEYSSLRETFIQGGDGFVFVYSITEDSSFEDVQKIKRDVFENVARPVDLSTPVILIGNKCDLEEDRAVTIEEGAKLAEEWGSKFLETSALSNTNVEEMFQAIVSTVLEKNPLKGTAGGAAVLGAGSDAHAASSRRRRKICSLL
jgi:small GTP-binding protein